MGGEADGASPGNRFLTVSVLRLPTHLPPTTNPHRGRLCRQTKGARPMADTEELTLAELSKRSGVEPHTLTRWASRGIFPGVPKHVGSGNGRTWHPGQVPIAVVLGRAMRAGIGSTVDLRKLATECAMVDEDAVTLEIPLTAYVSLVVER